MIPLQDISVAGIFNGGMSFIEQNLTNPIDEKQLAALVSQYVQRVFCPEIGYYLSFTTFEEVLLRLSVQGLPLTFFQIESPLGSIIYTTGKDFILDVEGKIVTSDEGYVLHQGYTFPPDTTALKILPNGSIFAYLLSTIEWIEIGRIEVAQFMNPNGLADLGNGYYEQTMASGEPTRAVPGDEGSFDNITIYFENASMLPVAHIEYTSTVEMAVNNYIRGYVPLYDTNQYCLINSVFKAVLGNPVNSIDNTIKGIINNINQFNLSDKQKFPLLIALQEGLSCYEYLLAAIDVPSNNWYSSGYFAPDASENMARLPYWVCAAIYGALAQPDQCSTSNQMVASLLGGLGVSNAKIIHLIPYHTLLPSFYTRA